MFQIDDIVVCVNNNFDTKSGLSDTLTLGKTYKVTSTYNDKHFLNVVSDKQTEQRYWTIRFVHLTKYRRYKLEKICSKLVIQ